MANKDLAKAKEALDQFNKNQFINMPRFELDNYCTNNLELADSYSDSKKGQMLDVTVSTAKQVAKQEKKPDNFYLEKTDSGPWKDILNSAEALRKLNVERLSLTDICAGNLPSGPSDVAKKTLTDPEIQQELSKMSESSWAEWAEEIYKLRNQSRSSQGKTKSSKFFNTSSDDDDLDLFFGINLNDRPNRVDIGSRETKTEEIPSPPRSSLRRTNTATRLERLGTIKPIEEIRQN